MSRLWWVHNAMLYDMSVRPSVHPSVLLAVRLSVCPILLAHTRIILALWIL